MIDDGNSFFQDFVSDVLRFTDSKGNGIGTSWFDDIISASAASILLERCSNEEVVSSLDLSEFSSVMLAASSFGGTTTRKISDWSSKSEKALSFSVIHSEKLWKKKEEEDLIIYPCSNNCNCYFPVATNVARSLCIQFVTNI